jgi:hypothetical protein
MEDVISLILLHKNSSIPLFLNKSVLQNYEFLYSFMDGWSRVRGEAKPAPSNIIPEPAYSNIIKRWQSFAEFPKE